MQIQTDIKSKLNKALSPVHLEVTNESHNHNVAPGSETHFKVVAVSDAFAGANPLQRHRFVYDVLSEELAGGVHALTLHLHSPEEWDAVEVPDSPPCLGGGSEKK